MLSLLGGCGKHWDVSSPAMLLVPTPLQGGLDTFEAGGHTHIIAVVRLFCSLGSFCKWILPKKPFAEPSLPMPPRTCTHYHVPHKGLLSLTSGFSSILCPLGREQVHEAAHQHPSWAVPTYSTWEELTFGAQPSPGVNCPHLMQKIGSTLGMSLVYSNRS